MAQYISKTSSCTPCVPIFCCLVSWDARVQNMKICFLVCVENARGKKSTLHFFFVFVGGYQTKDLNMNTASDGWVGTWWYLRICCLWRQEKVGFLMSSSRTNLFNCLDINYLNGWSHTGGYCTVVSRVLKQVHSFEICRVTGKYAYYLQFHQ